ncbi:MAG: hypothetical protein ACTHU0_30180 [Kofleriaceae bacterium]
MQERLIAGPSAALGVPSTATPAEVRRAFLELTKTYHPARFGRMSPEIQRLSNEVFLSLRAAHDALARTGSATRRSGAIPVVSPGAPSGPMRAVPAPIPATPRQVTSPIASRGLPRSPEPSSGTPRPGPETAAGSGPQRWPGSVPGPRARTPALGVRVTTPSGKATGTAPRLGVAAPATPRTEAQILDLLARGQWEPAKIALAELTARQPAAPRYQALLCYARGREAQLAQRLDEARVELTHALQLDPDLQLAKTALGELFSRRK